MGKVGEAGLTLTTGSGDTEDLIAILGHHGMKLLHSLVTCAGGTA